MDVGATWKGARLCSGLPPVSASLNRLQFTSGAEKRPHTCPKDYNQHVVTSTHSIFFLLLKKKQHTHTHTLKYYTPQTVHFSFSPFLWFSFIHLRLKTQHDILMIFLRHVTLMRISLFLNCCKCNISKTILKTEMRDPDPLYMNLTHMSNTFAALY